MGQTNNIGQSSMKQLTDRYFIERQLPTSNCKLLRDRHSPRLFLLKQTTLTSGEELNQLTAKLRVRKQIRHEHYLSLEDYFVRSESTFCSTFHRVGAVYERAEHTLRDEVAARIQEGKGFREKELWSILCSCAIVMAHLERNGVFYKGITPEDIFLSDDGIVKIVDPELCSISEVNDLKPYYAPEFLASHRQSTNGVVFSLGMCIMELIFLQALFDCYNYDEYAFNDSMFNVRMAELDKLKDVSDNLKGVLFKILKSSDRQRPGIIQLEEILYQLADQAFGETMTESIKPNKQNMMNLIPSEANLKSVQAIPMIPEHEEFSEPVPDKVLVDLENPDEAEDKIDGVLTDRSHNILANSNSNRLIAKTKEAKGISAQQNVQQVKQTSNTTNTTNSGIKTMTPYVFKKNNTTTAVSVQQNAARPSTRNQTLYTDPKLLALVKQDLQDIHMRKSICSMDFNQQKIADDFEGRPSLPCVKVEFTQQSSRQVNAQPRSSDLSPINFEKPSASKQNHHQNELKFVNEIYNKGRYEGQKKNGMRHGYGTFYYLEGGKYTGEWKDNRMDGKGTLYYYNQKVAYEGEWKEDRLWGYGILYNQQPRTLMQPFDYSNFDDLDQFWLRYEGNFVDDNKSGQGTLFLTNGERFQGQFEGDAIHGEGLFYSKQGRVIQGVWQDNLLTKKY